jgi:hypothetical protein
MRYRLILLIILFSLFACGGLPTVREMRYTSDTFEPTANVEVLQTWPRDRKYLEIAELEVAAGAKANNALRDKAMEMGADAIVVGPPHQHGQVHVPIGGTISDGPAGSFRGVPLNSVRAVAIKYQP